MISEIKNTFQLEIDEDSMSRYQEHVHHNSVISSPYCTFLLKTLAGQQEFRNAVCKNWYALTELSDLTEAECKNEYEWIDTTTTPVEKFATYSGMTNYIKSPAISSFGKRSSEYKFQGSTNTFLSDQDNVITAIEEMKLKDCSRSQESIEETKEAGTVDSDVKRNDVNINVLDDVRKIQEVFICPRDILITQMPYFERFFTFGKNVEDVQISVHCDLEVFKRLMSYIGEGTSEFSLDPKYAIHILVSAHFLQMESLVDICLQYCHEKMNSILETSCPVGSLNDELVERISSRFTSTDVEALVDIKDKIKSRMFKVLALNLIKQDCYRNEGLMKCSICEKIFLSKLQSAISCKPARLIVGQRGQLVFFHMKDQLWDKVKYLEELFEEHKSWRHVFWKIWSMMHTLNCCICGQTFACCDFKACCYHPESPVYPEDDDKTTKAKNVGYFSCCGQKTWRFNLFDPKFCLTGCAFKYHIISSEEKQTEVYSNMINHKELVCLTPSFNSPDRKELLESMLTVSVHSVDSLPNPVDTNFSDNQKDGVTPQLKSQISDTNIGDFKKRSIRIGQQNILSVLSSSLSHSDITQNESQIWNSGNSLWHNQDGVREYDCRQLDILTAHLQRLHGTSQGKHTI